MEGIGREGEMAEKVSLRTRHIQCRNRTETLALVGEPMVTMESSSQH